MQTQHVIALAANQIRTVILQSQERAVKSVNQEQLALYYGIGRFISANTRNKNWGSGVIDTISSQLRQELPGLREVGARNLKNMRSFYEAWSDLDSNSAVMTARINANSAVATAELEKPYANERNTIRQLQLTNYPDFPLLRAEWTSEMEADRISTAQVSPKYRPNQPTRPDQMYRLTDAAKEWKGK